MEFSSNRRKLLGAAGAAACIAPVRRAMAATPLPQAPLRIFVGYPVGGGSDVLLRVIVERLKERLNRNVLIENRAGASGVLAGAAMKTAPTDGSTILFAPSSATVAQMLTRKNMPFDLEKDLAPITLAGTVSAIFVVSSQIGVSTLAEDKEWLQTNPDKRDFGTAAMGSSTHFFGVELGQALGFKLDPVAYKGTGPLLTDLVGGHVPAGCGGITSFLQHHRSGSVRILVDSSPKRTAIAPELPSIAEVGHPELANEGFYAFYAPAKVEPGLIATWNTALRAVIEQPDIRQRLAEIGMVAATSTPEGLFTYQRGNIEAFAKSMKNVGYEPE